MRLLGITIPDDKRLEIGLTAIYGIGRVRAKKILDEVKIDYGKKGKDASTEEENKIRKTIEQMTLEGELKRQISTHIKRLKDTRSYRGSRHTKHLPARGQRSKTNSRTVRGNVRRTMGSGRTKVDKK